MSEGIMNILFDEWLASAHIKDFKEIKDNKFVLFL